MSERFPKKAPIPLFNEHEKILPLVIIDTTDRPDVDDMIAAHEHVGTGDVTTVWARPSRFDHSRVWLVLTFVTPSRCVVIIEFDVAEEGGVVDEIVRKQGLYLQAGRKGDRLATTFDHKRILLEVPSRDFRDAWQGIFKKGLNKKFRAMGLSRREAREKANEFILKWREIWSRSPLRTRR